MWNKVLGKSGHASSDPGSSRRKESSSSRRERRAESVVAPEKHSHPLRNSTFPANGPESVASSYATAPTRRDVESDSTIRPSRSEKKTEYRVTDKGVERIRARSTSEERKKKDKERDSSRERDEKRRARREERREERKRDKDDQERRHGKKRSSSVESKKSHKERESERGPADQVAGSSFSQFPGQSDAPMGGPSPSHLVDPHETEVDGHGLASDYYMDKGEPVGFQPGMGPRTPNMLVNPDQRPMAAGLEAHPAEDTGHGAAAEYYAGTEYPTLEPQSYAAGATALSAAAVHGVQEHYLHHGHEYSQTSGAPDGAGPTDFGPYYRPHMPSNPGSFAAAAYGAGGLVPGGVLLEQKHRGPMTKFVDWWKDYEDVRKMEAYTEYIGVCRHCFDPNSNIYDAPRQHHFKSNRKQRSRESLVSASGRIDKESRYHTSDNEKRRKSNKAGWVGAGVAAYGLVKVAKSLWGDKRDFDDTYSVKSGELYSSRESGNDSRLSLASRHSDSNNHRSRQIHGIVRHKAGSRSDDSDFVEVVAEGGQDYSIVRKKKHRHGSRSRSSSRDGKGKFLGAALGATAGAYALHEYGKHSGRRSKSPMTVTFKPVHTHRSRSRSSEHSKYSRRRSSHGHEKKKRAFFNFGNASSSSSDSGLVYGFPAPRRKSSVKSSSGRSLKSDGKRHSRHQTSDEKLNATLVGLGTTAAALAAANASGSRHGRRHNADLIAVKDRKGKKRATESALLSAPTGHKHRRRHSGVSNGSSSSSSLSIASWRDTGAHDKDDDWEDESVVDGDNDHMPHSPSSDGIGEMTPGLAYGDDSWRKNKARRSTESSASDASSTNKWLWRWGGKKEKKPRRKESRDGLGTAATIAGIAAAGAAGAAMMSGGRDGGEQKRTSRMDDAKSNVGSEASVKTMQTVYPVLTNDPYAYEAVGSYGLEPQQHRSPMRSQTYPNPDPHPAPVTSSRLTEIQQPKPVSKVSEKVYATQPGEEPGHASAPSGPPVLSMYDTNQLAHASRQQSTPASPFTEGSPEKHRKMTDSAAGVIAAGAAVAGVAAIAKHEDREKENEGERRLRREEDQREYERRCRREERKRDEERLQREERKRDEERLQREERKRDEERLQRKAEAELEERRRFEEAENERLMRRKHEIEREEQAKETQRLKDEAERQMRAHDAQRARDVALSQVPAVRDAEMAESVAIAKAASLEKAHRDAVKAREVAERVAQEKVLQHQEYRRRENDDVGHSWAGPVVAGVAGVAAAAVIADLASSNKKDHNTRREKHMDDDVRKYESRSPANIVEVTPSNVDVDVFDDHDALHDPDRELLEKSASMHDYSSGSNKPSFYSDIKRPRSYSAVIRDVSERNKPTREVVDKAEFWAPEELKHSRETTPGMMVGGWRRAKDDPNADVVFGAMGGLTGMPPYEPSYNFTTREYGGRRTSDRFTLDYVPRLNLIPPTPPPSRMLRAQEQKHPAMDAAREAAADPEQVIMSGRPAARRSVSAQSHSMGDAHVIDHIDDEEPPKAETSRKPARGKVSWGQDQTITYDVPSPEPSILEGHEGHFPKAAPGSEPRKEEAGYLPHTTSQSNTQTHEPETPIEEIVSEGAMRSAQPIREISPTRGSSRGAEPRMSDGGSFYQQPFYVSVSEIGLDREAIAGPAPQEAGFVIGEVETPRDEEREREILPSMPGAFDDVDDILPAPLPTKADSREAIDEGPIDESAGLSKNGRRRKETEIAAQRIIEETIAVYTTRVEWPIDDSVGLSKKERKRKERELAAQRYLEESVEQSPLPTPAAEGPQEGDFGLSKKDRKKRDKEAKRVAEATAVASVGILATAALGSSMLSKPAIGKPHEANEQQKDEIGFEGGRSTTKGARFDDVEDLTDKRDAKSSRNGDSGAVYKEPIVCHESSTKHRSSNPDDDALHELDRRLKSKGRDIAEDSPTRSVRSDDFDDRKKSKRRSSRKEGESFDGDDSALSRRTPASEPGDYYDDDRKKSKRKSKREDDNESVTSAPARYDDERERNRSSSKKEKRSLLASILGSGSSSSKRRDNDARSEVRHKSRSSSKHDDDDDEQRYKRKSTESRYGDDADEIASVKSRSNKQDDEDGERRRKSKSSKSRSYDDDGFDDSASTMSKKEHRKSKDLEKTTEDKSFLGDRAEGTEMAPLPTSDLAAPGANSRLNSPFDVESISAGREYEATERRGSGVTTPDLGSKGLKEEVERLASLPSELPSRSISPTADDLPPLPDSKPPSPTPEERAFDAGALADLQRSLLESRSAKRRSSSTAGGPTPPRPLPMVTMRDYSPTAIPIRFRQPMFSPASADRSARLELEMNRPHTADPLSVSRQLYSASGSSPTSPMAQFNPERPISPSRHVKSQSAGSPVSASFRTNTQEMRPLYLVERNQNRRSWSGPDSSQVASGGAVGPLEPLPSLPSSRASSVLGGDGEQELRKNMSQERWEDAIEHEEQPTLTTEHHPDQDGDYLDSQQATPKASTFPSGIFDKYETQLVLVEEGDLPVEASRESDMEEPKPFVSDDLRPLDQDVEDCHYKQTLVEPTAINEPDTMIASDSIRGETAPLLTTEGSSVDHKATRQVEPRFVSQTMETYPELPRSRASSPYEPSQFRLETPETSTWQISSFDSPESHPEGGRGSALQIPRVEDASSTPELVRHDIVHAPSAPIPTSNPSEEHPPLPVSRPESPYSRPLSRSGNSMTTVNAVVAGGAAAYLLQDFVDKDSKRDRQARSAADNKSDAAGTRKYVNADIVRPASVLTKSPSSPTVIHERGLDTDRSLALSATPIVQPNSVEGENVEPSERQIDELQSLELDGRRVLPEHETDEGTVHEVARGPLSRRDSAKEKKKKGKDKKPKSGTSTPLFETEPQVETSEDMTGDPTESGAGAITILHPTLRDKPSGDFIAAQDKSNLAGERDIAREENQPIEEGPSKPSLLLSSRESKSKKGKKGKKGKSPVPLKEPAPEAIAQHRPCDELDRVRDDAAENSTSTKKGKGKKSRQQNDSLSEQASERSSGKSSVEEAEQPALELPTLPSGVEEEIFKVPVISELEPAPHLSASVQKGENGEGTKTENPVENLEAEESVTTTTEQTELQIVSPAVREADTMALDRPVPEERLMVSSHHTEGSFSEEKSFEPTLQDEESNTSSLGRWTGSLDQPTPTLEREDPFLTVSFPMSPKVDVAEDAHPSPYQASSALTPFIESVEEKDEDHFIDTHDQVPDQPLLEASVVHDGQQKGFVLLEYSPPSHDLLEEWTGENGQQKGFILPEAVPLPEDDVELEDLEQQIFQLEYQLHPQREETPVVLPIPELMARETFDDGERELEPHRVVPHSLEEPAPHSIIPSTRAILPSIEETDLAHVPRMQSLVAEAELSQAGSTEGRSAPRDSIIEYSTITSKSDHDDKRPLSAMGEKSAADENMEASQPALSSGDQDISLAALDSAKESPLHNSQLLQVNPQQEVISREADTSDVPQMPKGTDHEDPLRDSADFSNPRDPIPPDNVEQDNQAHTKKGKKAKKSKLGSIAAAEAFGAVAAASLTGDASNQNLARPIDDEFDPDNDPQLDKNPELPSQMPEAVPEDEWVSTPSKKGKKGKKDKKGKGKKSLSASTSGMTTPALEPTSFLGSSIPPVPQIPESAAAANREISPESVDKQEIQPVANQPDRTTDSADAIAGLSGQLDEHHDADEDTAALARRNSKADNRNDEEKSKASPCEDESYARHDTVIVPPTSTETVNTESLLVRETEPPADKTSPLTEQVEADEVGSTFLSRKSKKDKRKDKDLLNAAPSISASSQSVTVGESTSDAKLFATTLPAAIGEPILHSLQNEEVPEDVADRAIVAKRSKKEKRKDKKKGKGVTSDDGDKPSHAAQAGPPAEPETGSGDVLEDMEQPVVAAGAHFEEVPVATVSENDRTLHQPSDVPQALDQMAALSSREIVGEPSSTPIANLPTLPTQSTVSMAELGYSDDIHGVEHHESIVDTARSRNDPVAERDSTMDEEPSQFIVKQSKKDKRKAKKKGATGQSTPLSNFSTSRAQFPTRDEDAPPVPPVQIREPTPVAVIDHDSATFPSQPSPDDTRHVIYGDTAHPEDSWNSEQTRDIASPDETRNLIYGSGNEPHSNSEAGPRLERTLRSSFASPKWEVPDTSCSQSQTSLALPRTSPGTGQEPDKDPEISAEDDLYQAAITTQLPDSVYESLHAHDVEVDGPNYASLGGSSERGASHITEGMHAQSSLVDESMGSFHPENIPLPDAGADELDRTPTASPPRLFESQPPREQYQVVKALGSSTPPPASKSDRDLTFAATLAAGLQASGMDPSLVFDDPNFLARSTSSLRTGVMDDDDPDYNSPTKYRRRGRTSRTPSDQSMRDTAATATTAREVVGKNPLHIEDDFDDTVATELSQSGFDLDAVIKKTVSQGLHSSVSAEPDVEPGEIFTVQKRKKKGKKGKGSGVNTPAVELHPLDPVASAEEQSTLAERTPLVTNDSTETRENQTISALGMDGTATQLAPGSPNWADEVAETEARQQQLDIDANAAGEIAEAQADSNVYMSELLDTMATTPAEKETISKKHNEGMSCEISSPSLEPKTPASENATAALGTHSTELNFEQGTVVAQDSLVKNRNRGFDPAEEVDLAEDTTEIGTLEDDKEPDAGQHTLDADEFTRASGGRKEKKVNEKEAAETVDSGSLAGLPPRVVATSKNEDASEAPSRKGSKKGKRIRKSSADRTESKILGTSVTPPSLYEHPVATIRQAEFIEQEGRGDTGMLQDATPLEVRTSDVLTSVSEKEPDESTKMETKEATAERLHRESTNTEFGEDQNPERGRDHMTAAAVGGVTIAGGLADHHVLPGNDDDRLSLMDSWERSRSLSPVQPPHSAPDWKHQDVASANEQSWTLPPNCDSTIQVEDSPGIPESSAARYFTCDSVFHDTPMTPATSEQIRRVKRTKSRDSPMLTGATSSTEPLRVSVEVGSDWDLSLSDHRQREIDRETDLPTMKTPEPGGMADNETQAHADTPPNVDAISPLQSATRIRSSILFDSSPSTREIPVPETRQHASPSPPTDDYKHELARTLGDGDDHATPQSFGRSPSVPLDTIMEYTPEQPPPLKRSHSTVSDLALAKPPIKAPRRTDTPETLRKVRDKSPSLRLETSPKVGEIKQFFESRASSTTTHHLSASERPASVDGPTARKSWPPVDEDQETVDLTPKLPLSSDKRSISGPDGASSALGPRARHERVFSPVGRVLSPVARAPSVLSDRSDRASGGIGRNRTPENPRTTSPSSAGSAHSLRRISHQVSGDLRAASRLGEENLRSGASDSSPSLVVDLRESQRRSVNLGFEPLPDSRDKGKGRAVDMSGTYEAVGSARGSPMSPTRPPSVRKRQSMHVMDLESKVDQFTSENRTLHENLAKAEHRAEMASHQIDVHAQSLRQAGVELRARDMQLSEKDAEIAHARSTLETLQQELIALREENERFGDSQRSLQVDAGAKYAALEAEHARTHQSWQETSRELEDLRSQKDHLSDQHRELSTGMEEIVRQEIASALSDRNEEIRRLNEELESARGQIKILQQQILDSKQGETFLSVRDEDYFDSACQQLCQHVQQWVLRFSKFSDTRPCRLSSELDKVKDLQAIDREKLEDRLDGAVLDGSDVDQLLADRVKRRDVFMSVVMRMLWEHVFTRYLFGMDREQRQKLKTLEKTLTDVGPRRAVAQWRAITLTLLARRSQFQDQRSKDTEAVMWAIYTTLAALLPPPSSLQGQVQESLRNVIKLAVDLSIEMRTQRAEYIMLPPLQPEYDTNGDLVQKVLFNSSLMNERSGDFKDNEELEEKASVVKIVLFPLVVKKGDDLGEGEDEIVICPAQVLIARPKKDKSVRVLSGGVEMDPKRSMQSIIPSESVEMGGT